jgi:hypothetical protein
VTRQCEAQRTSGSVSGGTAASSEGGCSGISSAAGGVASSGIAAVTRSYPLAASSIRESLTAGVSNTLTLQCSVHQ